MTTDIVTRLRAVAETGCDPDLPHEAAAEIDRLREALAIKTALLDEAPKNMAKLARIAAILEPLRALEAAATDAPWDLVTCGDGVRYKIPAISHTESPAGDWVPIAWFTSDDGEAEADNIEPNRTFIAAARNALPALLREIQETP